MSGYPLLQGSDSICVQVRELWPKMRHHDTERVSSFCSAALLPIQEITVSAEMKIADITASLVAELVDQKRKTLVLCGGSLEGAVTQIAVGCLMDGFDVFLAADACVCWDETHRHWFLQRIHSYGATISTLAQLALELHAQETGKERKAALMGFIQPGLNAAS